MTDEAVSLADRIAAKLGPSVSRSDAIIDSIVHRAKQFKLTTGQP
jgi:hypothetical protein